MSGLVIADLAHTVIILPLTPPPPTRGCTRVRTPYPGRLGRSSRRPYYIAPFQCPSVGNVQILKQNQTVNLDSPAKIQLFVILKS